MRHQACKPGDVPTRVVDVVISEGGAAAEEERASVGPVSSATERLIRTARTFDQDAVRGPSLCAGWTRAHVLSHVARNADGLANLLRWATTGVKTPMYVSAEARAADIDTGAEQGPAEIVDDLTSAAERFSAAVTAVPDEAWERQVRMGPAAAGRTIPARRVLWERLKELELHHVDLDADYAPEHWAPWFVDRALAETVRRFARRDDVPDLTLVVGGVMERFGSGGDVTITGAASSMLGWLTGRSAGDSLSVEPPVPLPALPPWA
jgi:maleylpyruvate isomerase